MKENQQTKEQSLKGDNQSQNCHDLLPKDTFDYAWKWFHYHASQRMQAFNFLIIIMGGLFVGYFTTYTDKLYSISAFIAFFGIFVSVVFFLLELRNEDLVDIGRDSLLKHEEMPGFDSMPEECKIMTRDRKRNNLISHRVWIRLFQAVLFIVFCCGFVGSLVKLLG